jgi:3-oxoacyl-[acyl-carrier-protein] synthase II
MAIHQQTSLPTIDIFKQDADCDLDWCAHVARGMRIDVAMSIFFGFGGTSASVVFRRI